MAKQKHGELPRDLTRGQQRLDAWRRTRRPKSRIPEPLWEMAVHLAARHGLNRTARALHLDYYSLKKRLDKAESPRQQTAPAFVELPAAFATVPECLIELEDGAVSLRLHLKGYSATDIAAVGRSVRGGK